MFCAVEQAGVCGGEEGDTDKSLSLQADAYRPGYGLVLGRLLALPLNCSNFEKIYLQRKKHAVFAGISNTNYLPAIPRARSFALRKLDMSEIRSRI